MTYSGYFEDSWVAIDRRTNKVYGWYNSGGEFGIELRVRLTPGNRSTKALYYTRGSHQDDVLRLQGTPRSVKFTTESEKIWLYGSSTVTIDRKTEKVISWDNTSNNLKIGTQPRR